ncbi:MAG: hypothetical protein FJ035_04160 [Chloroflexi bacterium]|nr:hypothetical protein [Chloroflexota bacterium]
MNAVNLTVEAPRFVEVFNSKAMKSYKTKNPVELLIFSRVPCNWLGTDKHEFQDVVSESLAASPF